MIRGIEGPAITIDDSGTSSNIIVVKDLLKHAGAIMVYAPAGLSVAGAKFQVIYVAGATYVDFQSPSPEVGTPVDCVPPLAGEAHVYAELLNAYAFKVLASSGVTGAQTYYTTFSEDE